MSSRRTHYGSRPADYDVTFRLPYMLAGITDSGEQISSSFAAFVVELLVAVHLAYRIYVCCATTIFHSLLRGLGASQMQVLVHW